MAAVPHELAPCINHWLGTHRQDLQLIARADDQVQGVPSYLWVDRWGRPMKGKAIQRQIAWCTKEAFGRAIRPHLFRACAVTELVECAPEEIGIAPDLLGHADLRTTRKHYIQAQGMTAHARIQGMTTARRRAVTARQAAGP